MGANLPLSFGRYEVQRVLGEGTMAAVYLAEDTQLGRQVAIKVPKFEPNDHAGMKRFFREARTMATLRHPHLCPVYDVSDVEGVHYFTMAYIEGGTLGDRIEAEAPMANRRVAVTVAKIASALHAAHQTGTVHRDLKPANVMIDQNNEPVVMDFGLAGLVDAESSLTRSGEMIGTPAYMSPEQITGTLDAIGPTSDVYSLGAIMYEMLTGQLPFGGSVADVVQKALMTDPAPPSTVHANVDPTLEAICLKAMSRSPVKRFASAEEMAVALRDGLRKANASLAQSTLPQPTTVQHSEQDRWASQAERVRSLWRAEQFAEALALLDELAALTDPAAATYVEWASQEIPKVRSQIEQSNNAVVQSASTPRVAKARPTKPATRSLQLPTLIAVGCTAIAGLALIIGYVIFVQTNDSNDGALAVGSATTSTSPDDDATLASRPKPENFDGFSDNDVTVFGGNDRSALRPLPNNNPGEFRGPPPRRDVDDILQDLDANSDGQLSRDEIPAPERHHIMRADTDNNGIVTREELDIMLLFTPGPPPRREQRKPKL